MQLHSDQISADACTSLLEVVISALQADTAQAEVQMAHPGPCKDIGVQVVEQVAKWSGCSCIVIRSPLMLATVSLKC